MAFCGCFHFLPGNPTTATRPAVLHFSLLQPHVLNRGWLLQSNELHEPIFFDQGTPTAIATMIASLQDLKCIANDLFRFAGQLSHFGDEGIFGDVLPTALGKKDAIHTGRPVNLVWASGGGDGNRLDWGFRG